MITPSDAVSELQRTIEAADLTMQPTGFVPELNYDEREQVKGMLLYLREAADDLGCADPHGAPIGHLAAGLDARAWNERPIVPQFTTGELDILTAACGLLAEMVEGIGDPVVVKTLRRLRLRAANMYVQEVGSDA